MKWFAGALSLFLAIFAACGCSQQDDVEKFHIEGVVTYQGQSVPVGSIVFQPDPSQGNSGPYGVAQIKDGKFSTKLQGQASVGGPHLVIIEAFDGKEVNPDYAPYGASIGLTYQERFDLPKQDSTLDIELTDRKKR
ncbi:hypothetical protein [Bremerella alba]|uniref:hypothetical protein n=1 Tax=Bremerella alba TaxID=980252 RepID=UPI001A955C31|nr:hypothetical protein [Bremerella alba]